MEQKSCKIDYMKPEVFDLGPVTLALGGSCSEGKQYRLLQCDPAGSSPQDMCEENGGAATACSDGIGATT